MREIILAGLLPCLVGCADFRFSDVSVLNSKRDDPGLPRYLGKHQSVVVVNGTRSQLMEAQRDALLILGCSKVREGDNSVGGDRAFIPGFVCGVGGETLHVTSEQVRTNKYTVRVVSYKRFPYPAATRFLDGDFCDLLVQLLGDQDDARAR